MIRACSLPCCLILINKGLTFIKDINQIDFQKQLKQHFSDGVL